MIFISFIVFLLALFPLTDTDIWWHLACARDHAVSGKDSLMWTVSREPWINVHEYFQQVVYRVFEFGGAPLLVVIKALLWGTVFALFLFPFRKELRSIPKYRLLLAVILLFLFRYFFEMRPVVFSLVFLGIFWNLFFYLSHIKAKKNFLKWIGLLLALGLIQFTWSKTQGLFILGPILAFVFFLIQLKQKLYSTSSYPSKRFLFVFLLLLFIPLLHQERLLLWLYPFNLFDRLIGLSPSATIFASEIIENRSPIVLFFNQEKMLVSGISFLLSFSCLCYGIISIWKNLIHSAMNFKEEILSFWFVLTAILALMAERNMVLLLPVFMTLLLSHRTMNFEKKFEKLKHTPLILGLLFFFVFGFWVRSLLPYDKSMVSSNRVPVQAVEWMKSNPHTGKLFNDDRMGGYLAWRNPSEATYIDGRFMLKTASFFETYLSYAKKPETFLSDTKKEGIDRAVFPLRYYARWDQLINVLLENKEWKLVYRDTNYVVFDRIDY